MFISQLLGGREIGSVCMRVHTQKHVQNHTYFYLIENQFEVVPFWIPRATYAFHVINSIREGFWDGLAGKEACNQAWQPESNPQIPHDERRQPTPHKLSSDLHMCAKTCVYTYNHKDIYIYIYIPGLAHCVYIFQQSHTSWTSPNTHQLGSKYINAQDHGGHLIQTSTL